ncbi:tRNA lysidine(34) synthetase TilS [Marinobacteraceae bacterium S3BR75-40.1]
MTRAADTGPDHWPAALAEGFATIPREGCWWVALSGGFDSVLLLHLAKVWLASLPHSPNLQAVHINHQLHPDAPQWTEFCRALCDRLGVPLTERTVDVASNGEGLEDAARQARYRIFEACLAPGDALLQAHHADDQAETVLFRLMRGSGVDGLAGIPPQRALGEGRLYRPLLALSRQQLKALPEARDLDWCEDPSNEDRSLDRNYIRHAILPPLTERWPAAISRIAHSADHCRETGELLRELAWMDLALLVVKGTAGLDCTQLQRLTPARRFNALRAWLEQQGARPPGELKLREGVEQLLHAGEDRQPELRWGDWSLRRYRGVLYLVPEVDALPTTVSWNGQSELLWGSQRLLAMPNQKEGIRESAWPLEVRPRAGGEYLPAADGRPGKPLKKWLQEEGIPPWERDRLPLFWKGDELVAVGACWIAPAFRAGGGESGRVISSYVPGFERLTLDV